MYGTRSDENNSVYRFLKSAIEDRKISIKSDGREVREYINVLDAARICLKIVEEEIVDETLIVTGHHRMRVSELLDMINEIMNFSIEIRSNVENSDVSGSHYNETPYSYIPSVGKKIITDTYCDLGQSLIEILNEIDVNKSIEEIHI